MTAHPAQGQAATCNDALVLDFLGWLAARPRPYAEAMEAWRTSCPRLTVWEDALDEGFVVRGREAGSPVPMVLLTERGRSFLENRSG